MRAGTPSVPALAHSEGRSVTAAVGAPEPRSILAQIGGRESALELVPPEGRAHLGGPDRRHPRGPLGHGQHRHGVHRRMGTVHHRRGGPHHPGLGRLDRFATILALMGAFGRLSPNPYINGIGVAVRVARPRHAADRPDLVRLPRAAAGGDRAAGDPGRDHRAQLQLRRVHDRDLPGRHPGRAARPARGRRGAGHARAPGDAPDRPAAGRSGS